MASEKFPPWGIAMYNQRGEHRMCTSEDLVRVARQDGFTSRSYVRSQWPKTFYHKTTGSTMLVGRLEWTDEQNAKALAVVNRDEWGVDFVAVPEPVKETAVAPAASGLDAQLMLELLTQMKAMDARFADMERGLAEIAEAHTEMEKRFEKIEEVIEEATAPQVDESPAPTPTPAAPVKAAADKKTPAVPA